MHDAGIVVIGRNEGERLKRCLDSLAGRAARIVYVDSGSTDGSVAAARERGIDVVKLDPSRPFCAARARNAGYERLRSDHPELGYVQFVDGDCEIAGDWLAFAAGWLEVRPGVALAAGRLRERSPEISIYNRLGELEWNFTGAGEVESVGGVFMIRCSAFEAAGGFDATVPAGEEPELCQRLQRHGYRLHKLDREMATHDLAMTRFSQWWRRVVRFGYASMDVVHRFGLPRYRRPVWLARAWTTWLALVLALAAAGAAGFPGATLLAAALLAAWPVQWLRIAVRTGRKGHPLALASAYAFFLMISHWPQMAGQLLYVLDRLRNGASRLVEHKAPGDLHP